MPISTVLIKGPTKHCNSLSSFEASYLFFDKKSKPTIKSERVLCSMNKTVVKMMVTDEKIQNFDVIK